MVIKPVTCLIAYTLGDKTDELVLGFLETDYQYWYSRTQKLYKTPLEYYRLSI